MKFQIYITGIIFFMGFLSVPSFSQGQDKQATLPLDPDSKKIMYREVVDQEGKPSYLYDKAIEWFGFYYLNAQSVYTVQSKENGKIEGQGRMKLYYTDEASGVQRDGGVVMYLIKLELKDNKYRYTLTDFNLKGTSRYPLEKWMNKADPAYNTTWDSYLYQVDTTMHRLISTMKEKMKPTVIKKDEW
ncbi:MAG: DUF4468 domain-containing protein [Bacteroidales bacterium]